MRKENKQEEKFKKRLAKVLDSENLHQQHKLVEKMISELKLDIYDCAAALVFMSQPNLYQPNIKQTARFKSHTDFDIPRIIPKHKNIRYRLEVGRKHQVTVDEIKRVLVAESGVDSNLIGRVDIRNDFTLIELPDGMPDDIYQLLTGVEINQQKLNIKRLKPLRNKPRRFRKSV